MNKKHKIVIATITTIILLILTTQVALSLTWTQYTPTPIPSQIDKIRTTGTYAMAKTTALNILFYNGSDFFEITKPLGENKTTLDFEKASNKRFYWTFGNTTTQTIYEYNPATQTWTNKGTEAPDPTYTLGTTTFETIICVTEGTGYTGTSNDAECWLPQYNTTHSRLKTIIDAISTPEFTTASVAYLGGNRILAVTFVPIITTYREFNGVSWITQFTAGATPLATYDWDRLSTSFKTTSYLTNTPFINIFNSTSATYQTRFTPNNANSKVRLHSTNGRIYYTDDNLLYSALYFAGNTTLELNTTTETITTLDIDQTTANLWLATDAGKLYYSFATTPSQNFDTTITITPNPSVYGQFTFFGVTPTHSGGFGANINVEFFNSTGASVYGFSGTTTNNNQLSTNVEGITWTNFQPNQNYTIVAQTNWTNGDTQNKNETWQVIQNATTNTTTYTIITQNQYTNPQITLIKSTSRSADNFGYFTGNNASDLYIFSADSNDINNLLIKNKKLTSIGGADYTTSLDQNLNTLFYGTNDELFQFLNATNNNAEQLQQDPTSNGFGFANDFIQDITTIDNQTAWVCRKGTINDDARRFNSTSDSFDATISETPCKSIRYTNDLLIIHKGTSGVKIYNATTQALINTITITSYPNTENNDMISVFNNKIAIVSATNKARIYDITNPNTPTLTNTCILASAEIRAIELLTETELLIATNTPQLRICDTNNNALFNPTENAYTSEKIKDYLTGEIIYEIEKLNTNGKFQVAEGKSYGVYQYQKNIQQTTTNNPPQINEIVTTKNSVCYNEILSVTILATDPDQDQLTYDWTCEGVKLSMTNNFLTNQFTCSYTTGTSKTIKVFVNDGKTIVTNTKNIAVSNCTPPDKIELKVIDSQSVQPITQASVTITGEGTKTTNNAGIVLFENLTSGQTYTVTASKAGYFTKTLQGTTNPNTQIIQLDPTNDGTGGLVTTLIINVRNESNEPVNNALISATEPITAISKFAYSDASGQAIITNMFSTGRGILSVSKEGEYQLHQEYFTLNQQEQKTLTITLTKTAKTFDSGRGCEDYLEGVILCSPLRTDFTGDTCTVDSDCITDRCEPSISSYKTCSKFNWTLCDAQGMDRGNKCFLRHTTTGFATNSTNVLLDNFLYVILFIAVFIMVIMLLSATRNK